MAGLARIISLMANVFATSTIGVGRRKSPGSSGASPRRRLFPRHYRSTTLHDRLRRVAVDHQPDHARRVLASQFLYSSAEQAHVQAVATKEFASNELNAESANPTGKDLNQLHASVVQAERAVADAANKLRNAALVHERTVLAAAMPAMRTCLEKSANLVASTQGAQVQAQQRHQTASAEYKREAANPSGKDLTSLGLAILEYEDALTEASQAAQVATDVHSRLRDSIAQQVQQSANSSARHQTWLQRFLPGAIDEQLRHSADAHSNLQAEVLREPKSQNSRGHGWMNPVIKVTQAARIVSERFQKWRGASTKRGAALGSGRKMDQQTLTTHQANRSIFRDAMQEYRPARTSGNPSDRAAAHNSAATAAQAMTKSGGALKAAESGEQVAIRATGGAEATTIEFVTATITAAKAFVDRQLNASEQLIETRIRQRSQFSAQLARGVAHYDLRQMKREKQTAQETSASGDGVIRSTMALKESQQPMNAAWEDIGNRIEAVCTDTATAVQDVLNRIDVITPLVADAVKLLEYLPWVKKIADQNTKPSDTGVEALMSLRNTSERGQFHKKFPDLPKVK